jgi:hypothetical protein
VIVIEVLVTPLNVAEWPPIVADVRADKLVPVIVIVVPPAMVPPVGSTDTTVGVVSSGVTELDVPGVPSPMEFVATTVKVYPVPLVSPLTVQLKVPVLHINPPGDDVTL